MAGLAVSAALAFAVSSSLKHVSAGTVAGSQSLRPRALVHFTRITVTDVFWLGGIVADAVGLALQLVALHLGDLALVQPLLVSGLVFALLIRLGFPHHRLSRSQLGWVAVLTVALGVFMTLVATAKSVGVHQGADRTPAVLAGGVGAALAIVCVELGRRQRGDGRKAALLGVAVGTLYAATAALLKAVTDIAVASPVSLLTSWQFYSVIVVGAVGLILNQLAFQAGPLSASLPATSTVDPLLSIVVGVTVYDEQINVGPGAGSTLVLMLLVIGMAVIQLARTSNSISGVSGPAA